MPEEGLSWTYDNFRKIAYITACTDIDYRDLDGYSVTGVSYHGTGLQPPSVKAAIYDHETGDLIRETNGGGWAATDAGGVDGDWDYTSTSDLTTSPEVSGLTGDWYFFQYPEGNPSTEAEWNAACDMFGDVQTTLAAVSKDSEGVESSAADCVSGTGAFRLIPAEFHDENNNGVGRMVYVPAQTSGTGVMTNKARVTSISVVDDAGYALRVIKAGQSVAYHSNDLIANPAATFALSTNNQFAAGQLKGTPVFVHPPIPSGMTIEPEVNMTWDCGGTPASRTMSQGYSFRGSDLGCPAIQKVVFRPYSGAIQWESYGNPVHSLTTSMNASGDFTLSWAGFVASGRLVSYGANSATLQLSSATYGGVSVCTPGTYTVGLE